MLSKIKDKKMAKEKYLCGALEKKDTATVTNSIKEKLKE